MNNKKTSLILGVSILMVLLVVGVYLYFLRVIRNKTEHSSSVANTLASQKIEKESVDALVKKFEEIENTRIKVNSYFVDPSKIEVFVEYLENLGTTNGVTLSVEKVEVAKDKSNNILVGVKILGTFANVMKTIGLIENAPYQIHITSSFINKNIEAPGDANSKPVVSSGQDWQADVSFSILSFS